MDLYNIDSGFDYGFEDSAPEPLIEASIPEPSIEMPYDPDMFHRLSAGELLQAYESDAVFRDSKVTKYMNVTSLDFRPSIAGAFNISATVHSAQKPGYYIHKKPTKRRSRGDVSGKEIYKVTIRVYNKGELPFQTDHPVEVRCECPAFQYYLAHPNLRTKNLLNPSAWNRQPYVGNGPRKRNPSMTPGLCKHISAVLWELERRYPKQYLR